MSNVAKINDSRRILDLRRDGWQLEKLQPLGRRALVNCDPESRSRVASSGLNWSQHGIYAEHKGELVCEFVVNIADDPMTKNIQNNTGCNDTIIRESLSGPSSVSVISNVDNIRRRLQRAMMGIVLNNQNINKSIKSNFFLKKNMVADDDKKGSIPIRLVGQPKTEEPKYIENLKGFRGGRPKRGKRKKSEQDWMGRHEQGNAKEVKRSGSMGCTGVHMDGRHRLSITLQLLDWNWRRAYAVTPRCCGRLRIHIQDGCYLEHNGSRRKGE